MNLKELDIGKSAVVTKVGGQRPYCACLPADGAWRLEGRNVLVQRCYGEGERCLCYGGSL